MTEELKPCAKCGGQDVHKADSDWMSPTMVHCYSCDYRNTLYMWQKDNVHSDALRAELARHQWQPIDTAPKDGTRIVALCSNGAAYVARWNTNYEEWSIPGSGISGVTHWMPLPEPPVAVDEIREVQP